MRFNRVAIWLLAASFVACSSNNKLDIAVEPNPIVAEAGTATLMVRNGGAGVEFFATRGTIGPVTVDDAGNAVAQLSNVTDVGDGFVGIQAKKGAVSSGIFVDVVAGSAKSMSWIAASPYVNADVGVATLEVAAVDAAGNVVAVEDMVVSTSSGRVESVVRQASGGFLVRVVDLRDRDANPIVISAQSGAASSFTSVTILSGAAAEYEIDLDAVNVQAGEPFSLTLHALDRWGNRRRVFGEVAHLSAYRRAAPLEAVPISPSTTNLFENGSVTMAVTIHGWGPDVVLRVSPDKEAVSYSETAQMAIPEPNIGCVRV